MVFLGESGPFLKRIGGTLGESSFRLEAIRVGKGGVLGKGGSALPKKFREEDPGRGASVEKSFRSGAVLPTAKRGSRPRNRRTKNALLSQLERTESSRKRSSGTSHRKSRRGTGVALKFKGGGGGAKSSRNFLGTKKEKHAR